MAPLHPTIQPKVHIPDITHPTFYSTTSLRWLGGVPICPPPSFQVNSPPPHRTLSRTPPSGDGQLRPQPQQGWPLLAAHQLF